MDYKNRCINSAAQQNALAGKDDSTIAELAILATAIVELLKFGSDIAKVLVRK